MNIEKTHIKYNKKNEILYKYIPDVKITYIYNYRNDFTLLELNSPDNNSNYKTTLFMYNDNILNKTEIGEKYVRMFKKRNFIEIKKHINKEKNTKLIELKVFNKLNEPIFWLEKGEKTKHIGFKTSKNLIKKLLTFKNKKNRFNKKNKNVKRKES